MAVGAGPAGDGCQFAVILPDRAMGRLELRAEPRDSGSALQLSLTFTSLSGSGNALFTAAIEERMEHLLDRLAASIERFCRGGDVSSLAPRRFRAEHTRVCTESVGPGDPRTDFVLACPVRELEWITDWQFDLLYSESGTNELDNIFVEPVSAVLALRCPGTNTTWYTTIWDTEGFRFEAVLVAGDLAVGRWIYEAERLADRGVRRRLTLCYTGLGARGNRILGEPGLQRRMTAMLRFVITSLECYLRTGIKYRVPRKTQLRLAAGVVGATIGRRLSRLHGGQGALDEGTR
jgi:hypothetical protein